MLIFVALSMLYALNHVYVMFLFFSFNGTHSFVHHIFNLFCSILTFFFPLLLLSFFFLCLKVKQISLAINVSAAFFVNENYKDIQASNLLDIVEKAVQLVIAVDKCTRDMNSGYEG